MGLVEDLELVEGYDRLKNAIVMQACNDYFICSRALKGLTGDGKIHTHWGRIPDTQRLLDETIEFFNGEWCSFLTNYHTGLTGTKIMERLDEMVEDTERWPTMGNVFKYDKDINEDEYNDAA